MKKSLVVWMFVGFTAAAFAQDFPPSTIIEAERFAAPGADVFRDVRASGGQWPSPLQPLNGSLVLLGRPSIASESLRG